MANIKYLCPKCHNKECDISEIRATEGTFSKIFDIQNKKFTSMTCTCYTCTEFYKTKTSALSNIFDLFTN